MNEKLTFTGGEPAINFDDLDRNNKANKDALIDSFRAFGDNYIIQGVTGDPSITAGYVMLDGEILQVDAHTKTGTHFVKVTTYDLAGTKTFNDTTVRQTWAKNRATITAGSGSLAYSGVARLGDVMATLLRATTSAFATTALAGIVEKATTAEAQAGTAEKYLDAALLQLVTATETRKGIVEKATTAETEAGTTDKYIDALLLQGLMASTVEAQALSVSNKIISPSVLSDVTGGLVTKVINIGTWNMDSTATATAAHGLTLSNIRSVKAMIVRDPLDVQSMLGDTPSANFSGSIYCSATLVNMTRNAGGVFDSTDYDSTGINRGWIIIEYVP